jgi:hypothetical protein
MGFLRSDGSKLFLFYCLLVAVACAPIWNVQYFINQDGSGHVYGSWILSRLVAGDPAYTDLFKFNFVLFPNSSGHWLLAILLQITSPFIATKIMATLTYAGMVAAVGCLRWRTAGRSGMYTNLLIGAVVAFNSLWLVGFYNFNLGLIVAVFTIGSFFGWREAMTPRRAAALASLLLLTFVSHIISFMILSAAIVLLALLPTAMLSKRNLTMAAASFAPAVVAAVLYKFSTETSGSFVPIWNSLREPYSVMSWINQFRGFDPFILMSRRCLPFVETPSSLYSIFAPLLWIGAAYLCLLIATRRHAASLSKIVSSKFLPFAVLAAGSFIVAIVWPDFLKFATSTGGVLRERVFLAGMIFVVPLFRFAEPRGALLFIASAALICVFGFQTAALWDYSLRTDRLAGEFLVAGPQVADGSRLAAITIDPRAKRFSSSPLSSLDNYFGVGRNVLVWDNYEFGHYLFPVVMRDDGDRQFAFDYTSSGTSELDEAEKLRRLSAVFENGHQRIDTLVIWDNDPSLESAFYPYYESQPYFAYGRVKLFKHK